MRLWFLLKISVSWSKKLHILKSVCYILWRNRKFIFHFYVQDLPESRGTLVTLLLVGMVNTIIQEIVALANGHAAAAYMVLSFHIIVFLTLSIILSVCHINLQKNKAHLRFSSITQHIGGLLYFASDNINKLVSRYGGDIETAQNFSVILNMVFLMILWLVPPISHLLKENWKKQDSSENKDPQQHWCIAIDMITIILKADVAYSTALAMTGLSESTCSTAGIYFLFFSCLLIGWVYLITKGLVLFCDKDPAIKYYCKRVSPLIALIGIVCFPLHAYSDGQYFTSRLCIQVL